MMVETRKEAPAAPVTSLVGLAVVHAPTPGDGMRWCIHDPAIPDETGAVVLEDGDDVTIWSEDGRPIWSGRLVLDYERRRVPVSPSPAERRDGPSACQEIFGMWVHGFAVGLEPESWSGFFLRECRATLITRTERAGHHPFCVALEHLDETLGALTRSDVRTLCGRARAYLEHVFREEIPLYAYERDGLRVETDDLAALARLARLYRCGRLARCGVQGAADFLRGPRPELGMRSPLNAFASDKDATLASLETTTLAPLRAPPRSSP